MRMHVFVWSLLHLCACSHTYMQTGAHLHVFSNILIKYMNAKPYILLLFKLFTLKILMIY